MNINELLAMGLLVCAVGDTVAAKFILPKVFAKNDKLTEQEKARLISIVNIGSIAFFLSAIAIFILKPL